jgi:gluconate 5-dehydrogenase
LTVHTQATGLFDVTGKVAFVPGGYGGIGEAIVRGLARHGARVVIAGRDAVKADALAAKLRDEGLAASGCAMDARSVDSIRAAVDGAVAISAPSTS